MKTTFDAVNKIYEVLKGSAAGAAVSGALYKHRKPLDSLLEDVVINSLPIDNNVLQRAIVNVNIYVPDTLETVNGKGQKMPNLKRFKELSDVIVPVLKEVWVDDCHFEITAQNLMQDPDTGEHFNNIRLEFYFENF